MMEMIKKRAKEIWAHQGFQRYFKNTGWMFFGQMISLAVSFFMGAWLARYLGPENYGVLNYSIAFAGLFGFIAPLGIDGILNRELIKFPEKRDVLLGTSFRLKVVGGFIAFFLATAGAFIIQSNFLTKLLVILFSFSFILQAVNVVNIYFQAEVKSKNNVVSILLATAISTFLKFFAILFSKGVIFIIIIFVLDSLWQGVGLIIAYNRSDLKIKKWKFDRNLAFELIKNSWPLMFASAAWSIYLKIDQVMIGGMLGNIEVGFYAVAVKLAEVWYFVPIIICSSLFPAIINAKKVSLDLYKKRLKNLYILMSIMSILIAIPVSFFAERIVGFLFGNGYAESINILQIYIWSSLGMFLSMAISQYLMSENLVKTIFWLNFSAMLINIGLNLVFIPAYGLSGAAWATLISYFIIPLWYFIFKR